MSEYQVLRLVRERDAARKALADLLAKVEAIEGYSTFGPDGSLDGADAVLRSDVLALLKEKP